MIRFSQTESVISRRFHLLASTDKFPAVIADKKKPTNPVSLLELTTIISHFIANSLGSRLLASLLPAVNEWDLQCSYGFPRRKVNLEGVTELIHKWVS